MNLAQLLQNLGSYLDFSKRLATTVPGLVMALAIIMLTASVPDWASRIYVCGDYRRSQRTALTLNQQLDVTANADRRFMRIQIASLRREYASALQATAACATGCAAQVNAADAARKALADACHKPLQDSERAYCEALVAFSGNGQQASAGLTDDERTLLAVNDDFGRAAAAPQCRNPVAWADIINGLLLFGALGFGFGVVLDPISKALFLQTLPEISRRHRVARAFVSRHHGDNVVVDGEVRTAQFAIGRGLITDGEYQALIDAYFRFSEVTVGLVLPVFAIGAAVLAREWAVAAHLRGIAAAAASLVGGLLLARVGTRRHAEFTKKVNDLIDGRLQKIAVQDRRLDRRITLAAHEPHRV